MEVVGVANGKPDDKASSRRAGANSNRVALCVVIFCMAVFACVTAGERRAQAAEVLTLAEYHERVGGAALAVDALLYPDEEEGSSAPERSSEEREVVDYVRREVAGVEAIVWNDRRFDLNNDQLTKRLDVYDDNTGREPVGRHAVLRSLAEHLSALDDRLAEVEGASAADADAVKGRLARILQRPVYNEERGRGEASRSLWQRFVAWLWSLFPSAKPQFASSSSIVSQVIVIALVALAAAVLLWKLLPLMRRPKSGHDVLRLEGRRVLGERLRAGQRAADLLAEAEALARAGEARAAIRKAYVALLCELGERRVVQLADHKTNRDYLDAVRSRAALSRQMEPLTALYERHWYGSLSATAAQWSEFRVGYDRALASLGGV